MYRIEWKKEIPILCFLTLITLIVMILYPKLPSDIPVHWNLKGQADIFASKTWFTVLSIPLTFWGLYLLILFLPFIDPKRGQYEKFGTTYRFLRHVTILFLAGLFLALVMLSPSMKTQTIKILPGSLSLLFILLGNFMGKIKPNWFVGIRLPWTLANETVWSKTHRFGGWVMVVAGFIGLTGCFFQASWSITIFFSSLALCLAAIILYAIIVFHMTVKSKDAKHRTSS